MKKLVLLITLIILFSFLGGCNRQKKEKIATPSDIEVRIETKPVIGWVDSSGNPYYSSIEYEGTVTNTGEGKAPLVKIKITWDLTWELPSGEKEEFAAFQEELFKNLRPGETRQFKGIMPIRGLDKKAQDCISFYGGLFKEQLRRGRNKSYYTVDVLPQENKN
jgi:hypothetical protein